MLRAGPAPSCQRVNVMKSPLRHERGLLRVRCPRLRRLLRPLTCMRFASSRADCTPNGGSQLPTKSALVGPSVPRYDRFEYRPSLVHPLNEPDRINADDLATI